VGTALVSHLHWDHVQGLPFFTPVDRPGARLEVYAPAQHEGSLAEVFDAFMRPPYFPVRARDLRGEIRFHEVAEDELAIGTAKVRVRPVPHNGPTVGYRVEWGGVAVAYVSDHQQPLDGSMRVDERVLELCDGVDLLIHDAQFTPADFAEKPHWGHCTVDYALHVAREAGARTLVLFHHDPSRTDAEVDRLLAEARERGSAVGLDDVVAAAEGLTIVFEQPERR